LNKIDTQVKGLLSCLARFSHAITSRDHIICTSMNDFAGERILVTETI